MPKRCMVCKKEANPITYFNSSFHLFPKNDLIREKWRAALNLTNTPNYKNTYICSDHFDIDCFHDYDNELGCSYTSMRKRLRSTAIPKITTLHQCNNENNVTEKSQIEVFKSEALIENVPVSPIREDLTKSCVVDQILDKEEVFKVNNEIDSLTDKNNGSITNNLGSKKRKQSFPNSNAKKKLRFMMGPKTEYVSRKDFVSDEAWKRFLRIMAYNKSKMSAALNKNYRKEKKIFNLKTLIKNLEQKQEFNAANYLKDLPPHVQELLTRMKSRKPTIPFPENLKTFARTLHFHSPAAYEAVRRCFLNCLPCKQTLPT